MGLLWELKEIRHEKFFSQCQQCCKNKQTKKNWCYIFYAAFFELKALAKKANPVSFCMDLLFAWNASRHFNLKNLKIIEKWNIYKRRYIKILHPYYISKIRINKSLPDGISYLMCFPLQTTITHTSTSPLVILLGCGSASTARFVCPPLISGNLIGLLLFGLLSKVLRWETEEKLVLHDSDTK